MERALLKGHDACTHIGPVSNNCGMTAGLEKLRAASVAQLTEMQVLQYLARVDNDTTYRCPYVTPHRLSFS